MVLSASVKLINTHGKKISIKDKMQIKLRWKQRLRCFIKGKLTLDSAKIGTQDQMTETDQTKYISAKQLLSILQKKGRLIDFLSQNLDHYNDEQVAKVARVIHDQCKKTLHTYCDIKPIYTAAENTEIMLDMSYDKYSIELTGNVNMKEKMKGKIIHQGWKIEKIMLPNITTDANLNILQPAEVEVL